MNPLPLDQPRPIDFGRKICGDLTSASAREWLVVNGIGGFACGTISGELTRRYHGLLLAALAPPLGRTLLVSKVEEVASYDGRDYALGCNRWQSGAISPQGYSYLERFYLEGTTPVFQYALGEALLEKRIFMRRGENSTYVTYRLTRGRLPLSLSIKVLANYRDYHGATQGDYSMQITPLKAADGRKFGLGVTAFAEAQPFYVYMPDAVATPRHDWYRGFALSVEKERGFAGHEDHLCIGEFAAELGPFANSTLTLCATTRHDADLDGARIYAAHEQQEQELLKRAKAEAAPAAVQQLVLAANSFVVTRAALADVPGSTIIAGYPWFGDWGRDTMISLCGLTLCTGRHEEARNILQTFASYVDRGMLPNRFPDAPSALAAAPPLEYNTADATLYYFEALRAYYTATKDDALIKSLYPLLTQIMAWHKRGTRYGICVMPDGLLYAGEAGVQLTWMDAKVGDWVVTPRRGKPVEINALYYNALHILADFAERLDQREDHTAYLAQAAKVQKSYTRFFNAQTGCLFDVLDGPSGNDASLRPNQILAVSLPHSPLDAAQQKAVVDACTRTLLTSHGLRSLNPDAAAYVGRYIGDVLQRDGAYHQGTVWGWLIGPFVLAHYRVYGDRNLALSFLRPLLQHLTSDGLGTISEIFDGDPPHAARGCFAQAWSVAEWLRAYYTLSLLNSSPQAPKT